VADPDAEGDALGGSDDGVPEGSEAAGDEARVGEVATGSGEPPESAVQPRVAASATAAAPARHQRADPGSMRRAYEDERRADRMRT
jgi:hypothetical protein